MKFYKERHFSYMHRIGLLFCLLLVGSSVFAQNKVADKIVAVVGRNRIILQSDVDGQFTEARKQAPATMTDDQLKCQILQQMIMQKLMVEQADRDSVMVSDDEVEGTLDNRIRYYEQAYGGKEKLEQVSGKTIYQLKEEFRDVVKETLIYQKMSGQILENVKVTPAEVKAFYDQIPKDSLRYLPATVEIGQIVIDPPVSPEMDAYAKHKLEGIRKEIVDGGKSFSVMAGLYSDDPGSKDNGGRIDDVTRTGSGMDPAFVNAVFKLQDGEVSPVIKSKFGYHIIKMIKRKGDDADVRHILIIPQLTSADFKKSLDKLDSVRSLLIAGKLTFPEAVGKFSTDDAAKRTGGMISDPNTGNVDIDISKLDPQMVMILDSLKPGGYSHPHVFNNDRGERSCRIVYLRSRTSPHKANLKDDYSKLESLALSQKKVQKMQEWLAQKLPTFYLKVDPEYRDCGTIKQWVEESHKDE